MSFSMNFQFDYLEIYENFGNKFEFQASLVNLVKLAEENLQSWEHL